MYCEKCRYNTKGEGCWYCSLKDINTEGVRICRDYREEDEDFFGGDDDDIYDDIYDD